jgi:Mitochondrial carrier protein
LDTFLSGAISGIISSLIVYPLELARTRMAMQGQMGKLSLTDIIKFTIQKEGGYSAFYKGGLASVLGVIVYKGVGFTMYEALKTKNSESLKKRLIFLHFSSGAMAAFCGQLLSYPIEVTKRRMQVTGTFTSDSPLASVSKDCVTQA